MKLSLLFLLVLFYSGCANKKTDTIDWSSKTENLKGDFLHTDSSLYYGLYSPFMYNDIIIAKFPNNQHQFGVCKVTNDSIQIIGKFLSLGKGPYEMLIPFLYWNFSQKMLTVYDYLNGQNKLFYIPLDTIINSLDLSKWVKHEFASFTMSNDETLYPDKICFIDENHFLFSCPFNSTKMFASMDNESGKIELLDFDYPDDGCNINSPQSRPLAYAGKFLKHPNQNRFVYFANCNRYMLILDYKDGKLTEVASPYKQYPEYEIAQNNMDITYKADCLFGGKIYVTDKYIYALLSDVTHGDVRKSIANRDMASYNYYSEVYTFDWDGNPIKKYVLEYPTESFWVSDNDTHLYTVNELISPDEGAKFIRYDLN